MKLDDFYNFTDDNTDDNSKNEEKYSFGNDNQNLNYKKTKNYSFGNDNQNLNYKKTKNYSFGNDSENLNYKKTENHSFRYDIFPYILIYLLFVIVLPVIIINSKSYVQKKIYQNNYIVDTNLFNQNRDNYINNSNINVSLFNKPKVKDRGQTIHLLNAINYKYDFYTDYNITNIDILNKVNNYSKEILDKDGNVKLNKFHIIHPDLINYTYYGDYDSYEQLLNDFKKLNRPNKVFFVRFTATDIDTNEKTDNIVAIDSIDSKGDIVTIDSTKMDRGSYLLKDNYKDFEKIYLSSWTIDNTDINTGYNSIYSETFITNIIENKSNVLEVEDNFDKVDLKLDLDGEKYDSNSIFYDEDYLNDKDNFVHNLEDMTN